MSITQLAAYREVDPVGFAFHEAALSKRNFESNRQNEELKRQAKRR
jgi:hypothetical protein